MFAPDFGNDRGNPEFGRHRENHRDGGIGSSVTESDSTRKEIMESNLYKLDYFFLFKNCPVVFI